MKKNPMMIPMTNNHLKNQNPFCMYDRGSFVLRTQIMMNAIRKKKTARASMILYTEMYPMTREQMRWPSWWMVVMFSILIGLHRKLCRSTHTE